MGLAEPGGLRPAGDGIKRVLESLLEYARPATPQPTRSSVCTSDPDDPGGDIFNRGSICGMLVIFLLLLIGDFVRNGGEPLRFLYSAFVLLVLIAAAVMAVRSHLRRLRERGET